eukprot:916321-Amphidinium_carterae.1
MSPSEKVKSKSKIVFDICQEAGEYSSTLESPGDYLQRKHFRPLIPSKTKEKLKVSRASVYTKIVEN